MMYFDYIYPICFLFQIHHTFPIQPTPCPFLIFVCLLDFFNAHIVCVAENHCLSKFQSQTIGYYYLAEYTQYQTDSNDFLSLFSQISFFVQRLYLTQKSTTSLEAGTLECSALTMISTLHISSSSGSTVEGGQDNCKRLRQQLTSRYSFLGIAVQFNV